MSRPARRWRHVLKNVKEHNVGAHVGSEQCGPIGEQIAFPMGIASWTRRASSTYTCATTKHPDGQVVWTKVGDGEFDNLGQIRAMVKDGYKETFTLETHWKDPKGKTVPPSNR